MAQNFGHDEESESGFPLLVRPLAFLGSMRAPTSQSVCFVKKGNPVTWESRQRLEMFGGEQSWRRKCETCNSPRTVHRICYLLFVDCP